MDDKITLDKQTMKALIVDTRLDILKLLNTKKYTQSELAELLSHSKPTIKEHLKILSDANLIKKEDTKRKWKYYSITFKGKKIVAPREVSVMFAFAINAIAILGVSAVALKNLLFSSSHSLDSATLSNSVQAVAMNSEPMVETMAMRAAPVLLDAAPVVSSSVPIWSYCALLILFLTVTGSFMLGYLFRRKVVIIR